MTAETAKPSATGPAGMRHVHVGTPNGVKYLKQLSRHFAHKIDVALEDHSACAGFPFGTCLMLAGNDGITFFLRATQANGLERMQLILEDHLHRFAWREAVSFNWLDGLPADPPLAQLPALGEFIDDT